MKLLGSSDAVKLLDSSDAVKLLGSSDASRVQLLGSSDASLGSIGLSSGDSGITRVSRCLCLETGLPRTTSHCSFCRSWVLTVFCCAWVLTVFHFFFFFWQGHESRGFLYAMSSGLTCLGVLASSIVILACSVSASLISVFFSIHSHSLLECSVLWRSTRSISQPLCVSSTVLSPAATIASKVSCWALNAAQKRTIATALHWNSRWSFEQSSRVRTRVASARPTRPSQSSTFWLKTVAACRGHFFDVRTASSMCALISSMFFCQLGRIIVDRFG